VRAAPFRYRGQSLDYRPAPFLNSLPLDDEVPDIPVKLDQFSVKRRSSPNTRPFGNCDLLPTADVARSGRAIPTQLV